MRRPLAMVLWAVGGVVLLAVVGIAIFAATFDANRYKPQIVAFVAERYGRTLAIDGDLALSFFPKLGLKLGRTTLSGPRGAGEFARVEEARVSLALWPLLRREVVVDRVVLRGLAADLVRHANGTSNFDDLLAPSGAAESRANTSTPKPAAADADRPITLDIGGISVSGASVRWRNEASQSDLRITDLSLDTGRIADDVPGELRFGAAIADNTPAIDAKASGRAQYRLAFAKKAYTLDGIDVKLEGDIAGFRALGLTGTLGADLAQSTARAALRMKLDETNASVQLTLADLVRPRVTFDVEVDRVDVDALRAKSRPTADAARKGAPAGASGKGASAAKPATDAPIDLAFLRAFDANGRVRIGALVAAGMQLQQLDATAKLAAGRLVVDPLAARLYDGAMRGRAVVDANGPAFALRETFTDVRVGALVAAATGRDVVEGRGALDLDVSTRGATVAALKRTLQGNGHVVVRDGALKGVNLGEIARRVQALSRGDAGAFAPQPTEKTDFAELTMSFVIRDGVAHSDDLAAKSPALRLGGAGQVDLGAGTVDYTLRTTLIGTTTGQGGKTVDQARSVTVPVRITGPLDKPAFAVDAAAALRDNLRDEAARRLGEAVKGRVDEETRGRIGDALKGLLGR